MEQRPTGDIEPAEPGRAATSAAGPFLEQLHPVRINKTFDAGALPVRRVSGVFWHHGSPAHPPLGLPHLASSRGRYHRKGQQPRLYASSSEEAAWGELFRHNYGAVSPFEIKRRMARLTVRELPVLDLTDAAVRRALGVTEQELTGNRYKACQAIATLARGRPDRFGGVLAPSASIVSEVTLVVFSERIAGHVRVSEETVKRPPRRLVALFEQIIGTLPLRVQDDAMRLLRSLRRELESLDPRRIGRR